MNKAYSRIYWQNESESQATPLDATNLNLVDYAVDTIDNRVVTLDTTKAEKNDVISCLSEVTIDGVLHEPVEYDEETGIFKFYVKNGKVISVDLGVEKIPVSFSMDSNGVITMTTADGTTFTADVGSLIKTYTFNNSGRIAITTTTDESGNKIVSADIVAHSIGADQMQTNYLANCEISEQNAQTYATNASNESTLAKSWAVGGTGTRTGEDRNNAKYYANTAETIASETAEETASALREEITPLLADAGNKADLSKSWAVGGTGKREGEDTNNAKYWAEQAQARSSATWDNVSGKPFESLDENTLAVNEGVLSVIGGGGGGSTEVIDNLDSTSATSALSANQGHILKGMVDKAVTIETQSLTDDEKATARNNIGAGTYSKATNGIPKADLDTDVQTSLSKADTALQTHQDISGKQDKLIAGDNITIENNVISAIGGSGASIAEDVSYTDTYSLGATNVQSAIDTLASPKVYSSEEVDTGEIWLNGKHIYEKCYYRPLSSTPLTTTYVVDANLKPRDVDVVSMDFVYSETATGQWCPPRLLYINSAYYNVMPTLHATAGLQIGISQYKVYGYNLKIRYTKK